MIILQGDKLQVFHQCLTFSGFWVFVNRRPQQSRVSDPSKDDWKSRHHNLEGFYSTYCTSFFEEELRFPSDCRFQFLKVVSFCTLRKSDVILCLVEVGLSVWCLLPCSPISPSKNSNPKLYTWALHCCHGCFWDAANGPVSTDDQNIIYML